MYPYNKELAFLIGSLTGDGHLQEDRSLISYYAKDLHDIEFHNNLFNRMFNIKGHIYPDKKAHKLFFYSKPLSSFLIRAGMPIGNKLECKFEIPLWIIGGLDIFKSYYLSGLYSAEASIYNTVNNRWTIAIEMYKHIKYRNNGKKYMDQVRQILNSVGVKTSKVHTRERVFRKSGEISVGYRIDIGKKEFGNFFKQIGFSNRNKQNKLIFALRG